MDALSPTFPALADPTRRAILARLVAGEASLSELAEPFAMVLPAGSKHPQVLECAGLISRGRAAPFRPARIEPKGVASVEAWSGETYRLSTERLDPLEDDLRAMLGGSPPSAGRPVRTAASNAVYESLQAILAEHRAEHGSFVLERLIEAPSDCGSAAFATAQGKARGFHGPQAQVETRSRCPGGRP
jgi:DNA-binding transcriptional ArsR family regulator